MSLGRHTAPGIVLALAVLGSPTLGQQETPAAQEPIGIDKVEKETVRLLLVDVLVLDKDDATVPGLTADDFFVLHNGRRVEIDTLDDYCDAGAAEPDATRYGRDRAPVAAAEGGRRIVFALDYQHIGFLQRSDVFSHARKWIREEMAADDEVMLAALTGGVRVEQPFTADRERLLQSLKRMEHDVTLWNGNFRHLNEIGWVNGVTSLLDVVDQNPGRKALVLYSNMDDVPLDLQFARIAAQAAASRCAIYPVNTAGLASAPPAYSATRDLPRSIGGG